MSDSEYLALFPDIKAFWDRYFGTRPSAPEKGLAKFAGVSPGAVSNWRQGNTGVDPQHVSKLISITQDQYRLTKEEMHSLLGLSLRHESYSDPAIRYITTMGCPADPDGALPQLHREHLDLEARYDQVHTELEQRRREARAYILLEQVTRELVRLLNPLAPLRPSAADVSNFIYRQIFPCLQQLFVEVKRLRGSIYLPQQVGDVHEILRIVWHFGLRGDALDVNQWYGGPDPVPAGMERGLPGWVYFEGIGAVTGDVDEAKRFVDIYQSLLGRKRAPEERGYRSMLHAPLPTLNGKQTMGVLCLDSWDHVFTSYDLQLVMLFVQRLGWMLETTSPVWVPSHEGTHVPSTRSLE